MKGSIGSRLEFGMTSSRARPVVMHPDGTEYDLLVRLQTSAPLVFAARDKPYVFLAPPHGKPAHKQHMGLEAVLETRATLP